MNDEREHTPDTWRYMVVREFYETSAGNIEKHYTVREVYIDSGGEITWTETAISACGERWIRCAEDLEQMTQALRGPMLDLTTNPPSFISAYEAQRR